MTTEELAAIKARHEAGRAKDSGYSLGEVIGQLDYLHSLEQLHDKDYGWETQLTNVVWWAQDLIEGGVRSPSVEPKIWDAFIIGDFDTTLAVATDGARHYLKEAIDDRAALLAEVERLRAALADAWDEGHSEHQDAHESGRPSRPNPYRRRDAGDDRR